MDFTMDFTVGFTVGLTMGLTMGFTMDFTTTTRLSRNTGLDNSSSSVHFLIRTQKFRMGGSKASSDTSDTCPHQKHAK